VTGRRFTTVVVAVSALSALAVALIVDGARGGTVALEISGGFIGLVALLGLAALARVVVVTEQARRGR
jgi:hypothetical protein